MLRNSAALYRTVQPSTVQACVSSSLGRRRQACVVLASKLYGE